MSVSGNHSNPGGSFCPTSDSKHYPLVIHHNVSSGASGRARVEKCSPCDEYIPQPPNNVSPGVPPWVHVFAKSATASSLRTQAAMIAHTEVPFCHKVHHKRILCAKKKFKKQQTLLSKVIVPYNQIKLLSIDKIDSQVVVFDGGNDNNPPIRPPDGVMWHRISIRDGRHIYVDDETNPDRGLTFARIDNSLPFTRLPRSMALRIIGHCDLKKNQQRPAGVRKIAHSLSPQKQ
jgi:hypothetical protein